MLQTKRQPQRQLIMLLSTFELLLKKITPNAGRISGSDRRVLQGYFLSLSNPNSTSTRIRLRFNATTPSLDPSKLLSVLDTGGSNNFSGTFVADGPNRFRYDFTLDAEDTGLFILQPNIITLDPNVDELEIRGFVDVFVLTPLLTIAGATTPLLVTPEHRGTFLPSPNNVQNDFDQLNVAIPTSTGAGLLDVEVLSTFELFPRIPTFPLPFPQPELPIPTSIEISSEISDGEQLQAPLSQILNTMVQRIETLEAGIEPEQS